jgi:hypothetical protein
MWPSALGRRLRSVAASSKHPKLLALRLVGFAVAPAQSPKHGAAQAPNSSFKRTASPPLNSGVRPMRHFLFTAFALLSGCASWRSVNPALVAVTVDQPQAPCGELGAMIPVLLHIHNNSHGILKIWIDGQSSPYELSWLSYKIIAAGPKHSISWEHGPGGHGPMPPNTLHIGPGDAALLVAPLYEVKRGDQSSRFRIEMSDTQDHVFTSEPFTPCVLSQP